jgi:gluconolactonase
MRPEAVSGLALASAVALGALAHGCARVRSSDSESGLARAAVAPVREQPAGAPLEPLDPRSDAYLPHAPQPAPRGRPSAVVDLSTVSGLALVRGNWRYSDVTLHAIEARAVGPDLKPSGALVQSLDYAPKAGARDFDDASWPSIEAEDLGARRGNGKLSFNWYRTRVTVPEAIGRFDPSGSTLALEVVVDDYAEIWVDGQLGARLGQSGQGVVSGFNAPSRVILARDVRPGMSFQLAIFGVNGPISTSPNNFIWIRSATLDFYAPEAPPRASAGRIERLDPELDAIVPADARIEKLAAGFLFSEGPVWSEREQSLLFSDPNQNTIYRYEPEGTLSIFRTKSGYAGFDIGDYVQPGSNGLTFDAEGRLTIAEHGNRRVSRLERTGALTVLAERFEGKRLNSPNDLVYKSDGTLYFTDPPFGLPKAFADGRKELAFSGIFRWSPGAAEGRGAELLSRELAGPNGLAFSPDETFLYVANWDVQRKVILRFPVLANGMLGQSEVFLDAGAAMGEEALDGLKVDRAGNVYVSAPGGVWIVSSEGKHVGTLHVNELPANFAWGGADRKALYMTARTGLYRIRLNVPGAGAFFAPSAPSPAH